MLANTLLSENTERLIELYYDRSTPGQSDKALVDRQVWVPSLVESSGEGGREGGGGERERGREGERADRIQ